MATRIREMLVTLAALIIVSPGLAPADELQDAIEQILAVGPKGVGHAKATAAWKVLATADSEQITTVLGGMKSANLLAENWLRSAAEAIAERSTKAGQALPIKSLEGFVLDIDQSPRARRVAFEMLLARNPEVKKQFLPHMLNDPSLELRRDAVQSLIDQANTISQEATVTRMLLQAFHAARDLDQIKSLSERLADLDHKVDVARHMGFIQRWHVIAPFDNAGTKGFDVAYPPEKKVDLTATYHGSAAEAKQPVDKVGWKQYSTDDSYGVVDLNKALANHKGAIAYAYSEFIAPAQKKVQFRLGCINGNKIWVNGQQIMSNHVYHTNMEVDQYVAHGTLKKGKNQILVKIAQNEQTENWAQRWQFQLRVCDEIGTAVLSMNRPSENTAWRKNRQLR